MNRKACLAAIALTFAAASPSAFAVINGWFDMVHVGSVDTAYGWICESSNPGTAPTGNLVVKSDGNTVGTFSVSSSWGGYRPDVPGAGYRGSNNYTGFAVMGRFWHSGEQIDVYYDDGTQQLIGGSGKLCTTVPGDCY